MTAHNSIDIHTHVVPAEFPPYLGQRLGVRWPSMVPAHACHRHVMLDDKVYRTVSHQCWDCQVRLADMDAMRIGRQVLSPMPELLSYWLAGEDAAVLTRFLNESIAGMVQQAPARFIGLGAVPLQDVERAIGELDHAIHQCGLAGVEIGSNIDNVSIGDARFLPFFEAAERWGAAIFVHALRPAGMDRLVGPPILEQALAFPGEVGLAAASLLTGGTLARCPRLRIAFSHGGGTLAQLLPRLQHAWESFPALREAMPTAPRVAARALYVDDLVYDAPTIDHLLQAFGATRLMLGSDYPFAIMDKDPVGRLDALPLDVATEQLLRCGNAQRWLGALLS
ncbi:amidohydrolase family protein [uncultured Variovorax sp.]|jgi:aminocarboxymuconate-semialdehyde decarboxylase|uniref:amidohydrolase family protein n=1 Tax=uncultured Variovorax sp. TaxID=114708 RepID=UPI0026081CE7|nr:amidohydrolase family protein [uncultured Variovorax sp.]